MLLPQGDCDSARYPRTALRSRHSLNSYLQRSDILPGVIIASTASHPNAGRLLTTSRIYSRREQLTQSIIWDEVVGSTACWKYNF